jgi:hypothetical protein
MNKVEYSMFKTIVRALCFLLFLVFMCNVKIGYAQMSVESYCQLSIQSLKQEVSNIQQLIALANQYQNDSLTLLQQETLTRTTFDQAKEKLYNSFGTTSKEYVLYMGKNWAAVNSYLDANPGYKNQIQDLKSQLSELSEKHDALKIAIKNSPPQSSP